MINDKLFKTLPTYIMVDLAELPGCLSLKHNTRKEPEE